MVGLVSIGFMDLRFTGAVLITMQVQGFCITAGAIFYGVGLIVMAVTVAYSLE